MSAQITRKIFYILSNLKPLTPIGTTRDEWIEVAPEMRGGMDAMWQNSRNPSCFSYNEGKTWHDLNAPKKKWWMFWVKSIKGMIIRTVKAK